MGEINCLALGLGRSESSSAVSRGFDFGSPFTPRSKYQDRSASRAASRAPSRASMSGSVALLRSAFGSRKVNTKNYEDNLECCDDTNSTESICKPILSFRGGTAWRYLEPDRQCVGLDLFWPTKRLSSFDYPFRHEIMPLEELLPLCNFRNLRCLKLTGMMQSYQKYIWQTVWLNPGLEELELEMGLEPCIRRTFNADWPSIKGDWVVRPADEPSGMYYGDGGTGSLDRRVGIGEYLDKVAIEEARERAEPMGCTLERLPVVQISLTGFVIDSDPFFQWFNPHRLRIINFKNDCVDAGFTLPRFMTEHVIVSWPNHLEEYAAWAKCIKPSEIKRIDLEKKQDPLPTKIDVEGHDIHHHWYYSTPQPDEKEYIKQFQDNHHGVDGGNHRRIPFKMKLFSRNSKSIGDEVETPDEDHGDQSKLTKKKKSKLISDNLNIACTEGTNGRFLRLPGSRHTLTKRHR
ncbi:hypothetical protein FQN57_002062 [Myotisia sp. PD_48]|nr:hypothetical protein FQN57_002062 [Myotisia sp. PD_48]